jgi:hypothetical protein
MRGRDGSDGTRDSGGVEIYDIYDAVEHVKQAFPDFVDPSNVHITGYSGGGGNAMSALVRFPDYFRAGSAFYGMSDYGFDPINGWYQKGASNNHKSTLLADIGDPTAGDPDIQDRYHARASNLASINNPYSEIHLFVNANEPISPPVNSETFRDNAGTPNITVHLGEETLFEDFNGNGLDDPDEKQFWPHGFPTANEQAAGESWYIARLLDGSIPEPQLAPQADLTVIGFVKTQAFQFWLGDGQNAAAILGYFIDEANKIFRVREILSNDKAVQGRLTIDTSDMAGETITVKLNDVAIETITGGSDYESQLLSAGDKLELVLGDGGVGGNPPDEIFSDQFEGEGNTPPANGWDLVIDAVTLSDTLPAPNQDFTVTATVRNIGNQPSPSNAVPANTVRIRVFLSKDDVPEPNEIIDDDNIPNALLPGATFEQGANVKAYGAGAAGNYQTIVCLLTAPGETDSSNNCFTGIPTIISVAETRINQFCKELRHNGGNRVDERKKLFFRSLFRRQN